MFVGKCGEISIKEQIFRWVNKNCLYIILAVFTVMISVLCFQNTINYDEFFSLNWCRLEWKELMEQLIADVHPPLYYMVLKVVLDLTNDSIFFARFLSAIFCIFFLWYGSLFAEKYFGRTAALFFMCFTYLNPFMIQKATEVRMYMMGSAFAIVSGIMAYHILRGGQKKDWIIFTLSSLAVAYIQYYGLLTMCFLYAGILIYFVFKKDIKNIVAWIKCSLATILGYLPWLPIALKQITAVNGEYWIEMPTSRLAPLRELFDSEIPYTEHIFLFIMVVFVLTALWFLARKGSVDAYWMLVCNSAVWGILVFSIIYAMYVRPILVSRYLVIPISLAFLGMSGVVRYLKKYMVMAICILCVVVGLLRFEAAITAPSNKNTTKTIEFVNENIAETDCIIHTKDIYGHIGHCLELYFPEIETIVVEEWNGKQICEIIEANNRNVWFLESEDSMDKIQGFELREYGTYGFGTTMFKVYKVVYQ